MGSIYLPYQKPPRWNIDQATVARNCDRMGLPGPGEGLELAMLMWEGAGNKAYDYSGNQNYGTITGADWGGGGLNFNGSSDYVELQNESPFDGFTKLTIFTRCMTLQPAGDHILISKRSAWSATGIPFEIQHSGEFQFGIKGNSSFLDGPTFVSGQWYNIVCTWKFDGSNNQKIYIDGSFYSQRTSYGTVIDNNASVRIGSLPAGGEHWNGGVDIIIIWLKCLSATQVQILNNNPYGMFAPIRFSALRSISPVGGPSIPIAMHHYNQMRLG